MKKKNIVTIIMLLAFKVALEIGYIFFVNKYYFYNGFHLDYSIEKCILSYLITFTMIIIIVKYISGNNKASQVIIYIILIYLYLPILSLYWMQDQSTIFVVGITLSFFIIIGMTIIFPRTRIFTLRKIEARLLFTVVVVAMTIIVYGLLISNGGLSRLNLNLLNVYETRAVYSQNNNFLLGYLLSWQAHVVNLVLLTLALYNKKYSYALIVLLMQIFLFAMTNFKSHLFAPMVILFFYFFQKTRWKDYFLLIMSVGATFLVSVSLILFAFFKELILIPSIFIRRLFYVPAQLHFQYYEFFGNKSKFFLSHSILEGFIQNPYNTSPVTFMAKEYFRKDFAPNVGFWGDAYVNFGFIGIVFIGIIVGLIILLVDASSNNLPIFLTISMLVIPFMSIVNSALLTTLLTHGILFCIFMLWLVNGFYHFGKERL